MNKIQFNSFTKTNFFDAYKVILSNQKVKESRNSRNFNNYFLNQREEDVNITSLNIDFDKIANNFQISGGSILNVLRYCVIQTAKRNNGRVLEKDIIDAIKIEYDKEGQTI